MGNRTLTIQKLYNEYNPIFTSAENLRKVIIQPSISDEEISEYLQQMLNFASGIKNVTEKLIYQDKK